IQGEVIVAERGGERIFWRHKTNLAGADNLIWLPDSRRLRLHLRDDSGSLRWAIFDTDTGRQLSDFSLSSYDASAWSPDSSFLVASLGSPDIGFLDPTTGRPIRQFTAHGTKIIYLGVSPDSRQIVSAGFNEYK